MSAFGDVHRGGEGPPLFLVHGFTATWRAWGPVIDLLEEQFEVIAPTSPGHTDGPDVPDGVNPLLAMLDGLKAMLDEVGWERPHVAGFSLGGQLALELARDGPACDVTAIAPGGAHGDDLDKALRKTVALFRRTHAMASRSPGLTKRLYRSATARRLALRDQFVDASRLTTDEAIRMTEAYVATPVFASFLEAAIAGERELEGIEAIDVPVTVLWGDQDRVLPAEQYRPFFERRLPHARFVDLKRAGHLPFWDATERVADVIAQTALRTERERAKVGA